MKHKMNKRTKWICTIAAALVFGLLSSVIVYGPSKLVTDITAKWEAAQTGSDEGDENDISSEKYQSELAAKKEPQTVTLTDVNEVVNQVLPAMVGINVTYTSVVYDMFGFGYEQESSGSASGFIVAQEGNALYIVTNNHVVADANSLEISFFDETTASAQIRGVDEANDLAVLLVDLRTLGKGTIANIKLAVMGDSDELKLGETVIAVGNALGYGQSSTVGCVSALNRVVTYDDYDMQMIQTDAAINPGNSGGVLLNARGEVIGINNSKVAATAVEGVCYAIPINRAIPIVEELANRENLEITERAYAGIIGKTISQADAQALRMPVGVYVSQVREGSPAAVAGLKVGNIIIGINGREVVTMNEFLEILDHTRGGTEGVLTVMILENGAYVEHELSITYGYQSEE